MPDPIVHKEDGWYFWNETWSELYGPYVTKEQAEGMLKEYCEKVLGQKEEG